MAPRTHGEKVKTFNSFLRSGLFLFLILSLSQGCITSSPRPNESNPESQTPTDTQTNNSSPSDHQGSHQDSSKTSAKPLTPPVLSRDVAHNRAKQIKNIFYKLDFKLGADDSEFEGKVIASFDLKPNAKDFGKKIDLDFDAGTVKAITVNGQPVDAEKISDMYDGHRITFKISHLNPKENKIEIAFSHTYTSDGTGLYRFKDPADDATYMYTNFEPYDANKLFPCFDQPDLKATYELTVDAPKNWHVISSTLESSISASEGREIHVFPQTQPFSTYVFSLHAGPYAVWKSKADTIPIRLFARKSLAKYVDHSEWFKITQQGLEFYSVQFGVPYPFKKYDQIIVPDFNAGAMENVGAVTFSERYVYRTRVTQDRRRSRADVILHEMAHMWFGDLVTMKWWNGLWLNESFATFMAATAVDKATDFKGSWPAFFAYEKIWAYWEDQLVTTHPIEVPVPDTDFAESNFDGITYGKGASTLKQLSFYIGQDEFTDGLQRYFQNYAYQNTTLGDFMKMLSEASGQNLPSWQKTWLLTSGVNKVEAQWECAVDSETDKKTLSSFKLVQKAPTVEGISNNQLGNLRPHRTRVLLQYPGLHQGKSTETFDVTYHSKETSVDEIIGKPCPSFVYPNDGDYDYVKVQLDPVSREYALKHLGTMKDPLLRQMLWHSLREEVADGKLPAQKYAETVFIQLNHETDPLILDRVLAGLFNPYSDRISVLKYLPSDSRKKYLTKFETFMMHHLMNAPAGSDQQLVWYKSFLSVASSSHGTGYLRSLLAGKAKLSGFAIDQERRWDIVGNLARNGAKDSSQLILAELKRDHTNMGENAAISAEVQIPDSKLKEQWLGIILGRTDALTPVAQALSKTQTSKARLLSLAKLKEAMDNYQLLSQEDATKASIDPYFETLSKLSTSSPAEDRDFGKNFARLMFPSLCEKNIVDNTTDLLNKNPALPATVVKWIKVRRQEEERCIRARQLASEREEEE